MPNYRAHDLRARQMKQNVFASKVFTFDKFQRHWLLSSSAKTNYHLFNLRPLSLLVSPVDVTPSPFHARSSFLISPLVASPWKEERWRKEVQRRSEGFSKSAQAFPIGLTSSFFPFPSLPPLFSLFLYLYCLFFPLYPFLVSFPCSRTLGCIADSIGVEVLHMKQNHLGPSSPGLWSS